MHFENLLYNHWILLMGKIFFGSKSSQYIVSILELNVGMVVLRISSISNLK